MTIIELNIAGLHVTRPAPSRRALKRSWQRNYRALRRNVKTVSWLPAQIRPRQASERPAA